MFGERIYYFRKQKGLSQKELAALLNVTNKAVSKWETGAALPKSEMIIKLSEIFNVSSDELLNLALEGKQQNTPEPANLKQLCEKTTELLQNQMPTNSKPKTNYGFTARASIFYLITTGLIFFSCIIGLFIIAISFWNMIGEIFDIYFWIIFELFTAVAFSGFYTSIFCYFYFFKTFSTALKLASLFLFPITFVVLFYGGIILLIPTVIKSIKVLINIKKGENG